MANLVSGWPSSWFGGTSRTDVYDVGLDLGLKRGGTRSAYLRSRSGTVDGSSFVSIGQSLSAVTYRNSRVRLSGYVRADSLRAVGAGLWMRVDGPTGVLRFDNMIGFGRAIVGTSDWVLYSVVLNVPDNAVGITIGALLSGVGTARVDDMRFEVVDGTVATTGRSTASAPKSE